MLGDDLVSITRWSCKDIKHDVLDSVGQSAQLLRRTPFLDIDTHQRHTISSLCKDIMSRSLVLACGEAISGNCRRRTPPPVPPGSDPSSPEGTSSGRRLR